MRQDDSGVAQLTRRPEIDPGAIWGKSEAPQAVVPAQVTTGRSYPIPERKATKHE